MVVRSPVPAGAVLGCGRAAWPATRATAALQPAGACAGRHIRPVIPSKSNQRRQPRFDREAYRQRNRIERLINRLKQFRRIATRYEKRGVNYLAMVTLGMILLWL